MNRTHLFIDESAIKRNIVSTADKLGRRVKIMCLVKANAYGHGLGLVANACKDIVDYFGVATVEEGAQLRKDGITNPILIVGDAPICAMKLALENDLELTVHSLQSALDIDCYCKQVGKVAHVHIAVDSGMGRIGFLPYEIGQAKRVFTLSSLHIKGIFSHFSKADEADKTYTRMQKACFDKFVGELTRAGYDVGLRHIANSAAVLDMDDCAYDMVRMGIMTYGLYPSQFVDKSLNLSPALCWQARVSHIKTLPAGQAVSYGGDFVTAKDTKVATLSVGYGDGYPRALSNKGYILIREQKVPIIGRICMDQTMVDISDVGDVAVGDTAVLIGKQGNMTITAEDVARWADTINYEVVCNISHRVQRLTKINCHPDKNFS